MVRRNIAAAIAGVIVIHGVLPFESHLLDEARALNNVGGENGAALCALCGA